jgi:hypothetical protein
MRYLASLWLLLSKAPQDRVDRIDNAAVNHLNITATRDIMNFSKSKRVMASLITARKIVLLIRAL